MLKKMLNTKDGEKIKEKVKETKQQFNYIFLLT